MITLKQVLKLLDIDFNNKNACIYIDGNFYYGRDITNKLDLSTEVK